MVLLQKTSNITLWTFSHPLHERPALSPSPLSSQKKTNKTKKTQKKQKISQKTKQQQQHNNETKNTQTHTEVHKIWKCSIYGSVAKSMIKDIPKAN